MSYREHAPPPALAPWLDPYRRALDAGCATLAAPEDKPHGQRVAYVRDPFGNLIELATPM